MISTVEIKVNKGNPLLMDPYTNGLYEKELDLVQGENTYTVLKDGEEVCTNTVNLEYDRKVLVRYLPYGSRNILYMSNNSANVFDSVNNDNLFIHCATLVGELEAFSRTYLESVIDNWNPNNDFAKFLYMGGGIFAKRIKIVNTLLNPYLIRYKIAFNNGWDDSIGFSDGSDVLMEIPAGTTEFIICVDTINRRVLDSINAPKILLELGASSFREARAFSVEVNLTGDFNGWNVKDSSYNMKQISKNLYVAYRYFQPGTYTYTCSLNNFLRNNGKNTKKLSLAQRTAVLFLYNSENSGELLDSINSSEKIASLLGFKLSMPSAELDKYAYKGNDLGATYSPSKTVFKVWAPSACRVQIKRYATGSDDEPGAREIGIVDMNIGKNNVWTQTLKGDLKNTYYNYLITIGENTFETVDIYAKAVGANGNRGMVVDLLSTNPHGWENDKRVRCKNQTDAVIWEIHVKDFSFMENSGISEENRGKYLAFTEKNTSLNNEGEFKTCLAHLKELGVTHVHLLPAFDYASIDEKLSDHEAFNWGYDPKNYNVPDGSYSSNPFDGNVRINEFKRMVQSLHEENIGVVLDVVYNHTSATQTSFFNLTVPNYYYRQINGFFANASGCGNETASERTMFRKYMIDSILYWAKEYHLDGFRFDLMGIHDVDTMNLIREALDRLENGKEILMYGEPWSALWPSPDDGVRMCSKDNTQYLSDRIAVFNDNMRDAIPGKIQHNVEYTGFVEGTPGQEISIRNGILAQNIELGEDRYLFWSKQPTQTVNYVSAHDNFPLYDKLVLATKGGNGYELRYDDIVQMNKISAALVITSQGIPFWQAGEEFARTKYGDSNSYSSPASVNALDWGRVRDYADLVQYYKGLIEIKKKFKSLRDPSCASLKSIYFCENTISNTCGYTIKGSKDESMLALLFNATDYDFTFTLSVGEGQTLPEEWVIVANGEKAGVESLGTAQGCHISVPPKSFMMLVDKKYYLKQ